MGGVEWVIEAQGCDPAALRDQQALNNTFDAIVQACTLHPLGKTSWHQFPNTGGITGVSLLQESHLACHTFPEYGSLCLNVFCCRPRPDADFESILRNALGATAVQVRRIDRPYA